MEFADAVRRRHMVRDFSSRPVDPGLITGLLDTARRAPSAGFTQAEEFVVLSGPTQTDRYWDITLDSPTARASFRWPGLVRAPVLVVVTTRPDAYIERYAAGDKAGALAVDEWPVPYWWVDAGGVTQTLMLAATDAGLGACLFGAFEHEEAVRVALGIPPDRRLVATIALGHENADGTAARTSKVTGSPTRRGRRVLDAVIHRDGW